MTKQKDDRIWMRASGDVKRALDDVCEQLEEPWTTSSVVVKVVEIFLRDGVAEAVDRIKRGTWPETHDAVLASIVASIRESLSWLEFGPDGLLHARDALDKLKELEGKLDAGAADRAGKGQRGSRAGSRRRKKPTA